MIIDRGLGATGDPFTVSIAGALASIPDVIPYTTGSGETATEGNALPGGSSDNSSGELSIVPASQVSLWLQKNATAVYIGAAALVAMAILRGRK